MVSRPQPATVEVLALALEEATGAALVLDHKLRVVATTPGLSDVFGPLDLGVSAPRQICGDHEDRPMAEALARGDAMSAHIKRLLPSGQEVAFHLRALPLRDQGELRGFLLLVHPEPQVSEDGSDVLERFGVTTREPVMRALLEAVVRVATTDANVLVHGEAGSGKELIARALHAASERSQAPFVAFHCAALPAALLESELFGHVRGAWPGALHDKLGLFQRAHGGTLYLEEVVELPSALQARLLRVLEERSVIPMGGSEPIPIDVRIVTATDRPLREAVEAGRFRADLMYRLHVIPLFVPARPARAQARHRIDRRQARDRAQRARTKAGYLDRARCAQAP